MRQNFYICALYHVMHYSFVSTGDSYGNEQRLSIRFVPLTQYGRNTRGLQFHLQIQHCKTYRLCKEISRGFTKWVFLQCRAISSGLLDEKSKSLLFSGSGCVWLQMSRLVGKPTLWFPNRSDTNWAVQAQMAKSLKFRM